MKSIELINARKQHLLRLANQQGAAGEQSVISTMSNWVPRPRGLGLKILLNALKESGVEIKATSFDAIELPDSLGIDFLNSNLVRERLDKMIFIEIKTANQSRVKEDFSGFFFALTENEIHAASVLGNRHKVALFNNISSNVLMTSVKEIVERSKSSTWQISIQL